MEAASISAMPVTEGLSDLDFDRFSTLIRERTGLLFTVRRRQALARGVLNAAGRITGGTSVAGTLGAYYRLLHDTATDSEVWDELISAVTVGETYFFRNRTHFDALRTRILPELVAERRQQRRLRIWSAGCASGEEPYSIAILLRQLLPDIDDWSIYILATDINRAALAAARRARYRAWSLRDTDPATRDLYFTDQADALEVDPRVRRMVTFAYLNLAEDCYPSLTTGTNAFDLIICRNVLIYLPPQVINDMVGRFHDCLVGSGWLVVGASETNNQVYCRYTVHSCCGATLYRREQGSLPAPAPKARTPSPLTHGCPRVDRSLTRMDRVAGPEPLLSTAGEVSPGPSDPPPTADRYREGESWLQQRRPEEAMHCFLACGDDPDVGAAACLQIARLQANGGQLPQARHWAVRAINRDPLLIEGHYTLAVVLEELGETDAALAGLRRVLYLDPSFLLAHVSLVGLYRRQGRDRQAERHRTQAIRLAAALPDDSTVPGSDGVTAGRLLSMIRRS